MLLEQAEAFNDKLRMEITKNIIFPYSTTKLTDIELLSAVPTTAIKPLGYNEYQPVIYLESESDKRCLEGINSKFYKEADIQIIGMASAYSRARVGDSVSHEQSSRGTIGCFIRKENEPDSLFLLGNNHVLANCNYASKGDKIYHPSIDQYDLLVNEERDFIFAILDYFIPLEPKKMNFFDVAIAKVTSIDHVDLLSINLKRQADDLFDSRIVANLPVSKVGSTTGLTTGKIATIKVKGKAMVFPQVGTRYFSNLIAIQSDSEHPFSDHGDSGAVIVERNSNSPLAILLGGTSLGITFALPIEDILQELTLRMKQKIDIVCSGNLNY